MPNDPFLLTFGTKIKLALLFTRTSKNHGTSGPKNRGFKLNPQCIENFHKINSCIQNLLSLQGIKIGQNGGHFVRNKKTRPCVLNHVWSNRILR